MTIKCIVVDDEPVALQKMKNYAETVPYLDLVAACNNPIEAIKIISQQHIDAIFTDINMLDLNGLDFVSSLTNCPLVVFVTAYDEYAIDSYKIGAIDYILKPYGFKEFQRAAERVRTQYELMQQNNTARNNNMLFVRADYKWIRIDTNDISHIQSLSDYIRITLSDNEKSLVTHATFANIINCLPSHFLQIHRSWIVNLEHIKEINHNRIVINRETYIPIGETYKEQLLLYLQIHSINKPNKTSKTIN